MYPNTLHLLFFPYVFLDNSDLVLKPEVDKVLKFHYLSNSADTTG